MTIELTKLKYLEGYGINKGKDKLKQCPTKENHDYQRCFIPSKELSKKLGRAQIGICLYMPTALPK